MWDPHGCSRQLLYCIQFNEASRLDVSKAVEDGKAVKGAGGGGRQSDEGSGGGQGIEGSVRWWWCPMCTLDN